MTFLTAILEAEKLIKRCFTRQLVKIIITVLSTGYASLTEPMYFVYAIVTQINEGHENLKTLRTFDSYFHEEHQKIFNRSAVLRHDSFVKKPAVLSTPKVTDLRLHGHLTLIAIIYGRLGDLFVLTSPSWIEKSRRDVEVLFKQQILRKN